MFTKSILQKHFILHAIYTLFRLFCGEGVDRGQHNLGFPKMLLHKVELEDM